MINILELPDDLQGYLLTEYRKRLRMRRADYQKARIFANKQKALAIRAAKEEEKRNTVPFSIVGRFYTNHAHVPLTPAVPINITPEASNSYDKNAHRVWAFINEAWVQVGYVDRHSAAILAKFDIKRHSARIEGNCATVVVQAKA
jgi:hypothetical protein